MLNQLNQVPNQRALLRNQRALANANNTNSNNNANGNMSSPTSSSSTNGSALSLLNAAAVVAAATNRPNILGA